RGQAEHWSTLVRSSAALTYRVEQLTGLTPSDLRSAPPLTDAVAQLAAFAGDLPVVGQSVQFDLACLERAGLRLRGPSYDTFELAQLLLPGLPVYDLSSIARALGVQPRAAHRALADADTAMDVFLALLRRLGALRIETLMLVNRLAAGAEWPFQSLT